MRKHTTVLPFRIFSHKSSGNRKKCTGRISDHVLLPFPSRRPVLLERGKDCASEKKVPRRHQYDGVLLSPAGPPFSCRGTLTGRVDCGGFPALPTQSLVEEAGRYKE
ncbi:UNVERIFIED_CONTAM: hypothetical protein K2H54_075919 [Gekko kuhli]